MGSQDPRAPGWPCPFVYTQWETSTVPLSGEPSTPSSSGTPALGPGGAALLRPHQLLQPLTQAKFLLTSDDTDIGVGLFRCQDLPGILRPLHVHLFGSCPFSGGRAGLWRTGARHHGEGLREGGEGPATGSAQLSTCSWSPTQGHCCPPSVLAI